MFNSVIKLLTDNENRDGGFILENIVFLELLGRGYEIMMGNISQNKVDIFCKKWGDKLYVQFSESIPD